MKNFFIGSLLKMGLPIALSLAPILVQAHPHVWIDYAVNAQMQGENLVALGETWTFSSGFPAAMVGDFSGMTKAGPVDAVHTAMFKQQAFSALRGANYFSHVYVNGKLASVGEARDFSVAIEEGHIVYRFVVPLITPQNAGKQPVTVGIYDDSFFVDFTSKASVPVRLSNAASNCHVELFDDHDHPIFGGDVIPQASRLSC